MRSTPPGTAGRCTACACASADHPPYGMIAVGPAAPSLRGPHRVPPSSRERLTRATIRSVAVTTVDLPGGSRRAARSRRRCRFGRAKRCSLGRGAGVPSPRSRAAAAARGAITSPGPASADEDVMRSALGSDSPVPAVATGGGGAGRLGMDRIPSPKPMDKAGYRGDSRALESPERRSWGGFAVGELLNRTQEVAGSSPASSIKTDGPSCARPARWHAHDFVGTPRFEDGWLPPMTALGSPRSFASMNRSSSAQMSRDRRVRVCGLFWDVVELL
jgi:hypothetical protein